jgi:hypothetical protein
MRVQLCLTLYILLTATGWAQEVVTRFGVVEIAKYPDSMESYLLVNGERPEEFTERFGSFRVEKVINWGEKGDVVVLSVWSGGASCCFSYRMLRLTEDDVLLSDQFGDHGYDLSNFEAKQDVITFHMQRDFPADIAHQVASYDGQVGTVLDVLEEDTGIVMAGADADVLRWVGQPASQLLEAADERVRFRTVIDGENLNHLRTSLWMGDDMYLSRGFVLGWGFWPRNGDSRFGYVGIEVATGKAWAAYEVDGDLFAFSAARLGLPTPMVAMIEVNQARVRQFAVSSPH